MGKFKNTSIVQITALIGVFILIASSFAFTGPLDLPAQAEDGTRSTEPINLFWIDINTRTPGVSQLDTTLGADENMIGLAGSATRVIQVFFPQRVHRSEIFQGDLKSQAECLIVKLKDAGFILGNGQLDP